MFPGRRRFARLFCGSRGRRDGERGHHPAERLDGHHLRPQGRRGGRRRGHVAGVDGDGGGDGGKSVAAARPRVGRKYLASIQCFANEKVGIKIECLTTSERGTRTVSLY